MPSVIIHENERGLLFKHGIPTRWLNPGRHSWWSADAHVRTLQLDPGYAILTPELKRFAPKDIGEELFVEAHQIAIVSIDGKPTHALEHGRYILWKPRATVEATCYDLDTTFPSIPEACWPLIPSHLLQVHTVYPYQRLLLYVNGALEKVLESGRYPVSYKDRQILLQFIDMREQELQITGQEVMSRDKVSLRTNLLIKYSITDPKQSVESVTSLYDAIYSEAQMVARRFIAGNTVDELLESRNEAAQTMRDELQPRVQQWGCEILQIDIKDIILPGDMKALLNRVIEAEKEAAANLILRREETAATRSLANTAKMLEKNPMLLRLKEIESVKEIAGHINQLNVVASSNELLSQLLLSHSNKND